MELVSRTFQEVVSGVIEVAVIHHDYPNTKLDSIQEGLLKAEIRRGVMGIPDGARAPAFNRTFQREGALVFVCADEQTSTWLREFVGSIKIQGSGVSAVAVDDLPKHHRVVVHAPDLVDETATEAVGYFGKQNPGVATRDWIVDEGSVVKDGKGIHFAVLMSEQSLGQIRERGFKLYCGLGRAELRPTEKTAVKEGRKVAGVKGGKP